MGFLNFDENGNIILTGSAKKEKDEEETSVVLTKVQVSESSPAIAQLRIRPGRKIAGNSNVMNSLKDQCQKYYQYKQASCEAKIEIKEDEIIAQARGSWDMYLYLKELMMNIRNNSSGFRVVVRGSWAKD